MLIDPNDPRILNVMSQVHHCGITELKELLNEDARLERMIHNTQLVSYYINSTTLILLM